MPERNDSEIIKVIFIHSGQRFTYSPPDDEFVQKGIRDKQHDTLWEISNNSNKHLMTTLTLNIPEKKAIA